MGRSTPTALVNVDTKTGYAGRQCFSTLVRGDVGKPMK